MTAPEPHAHTHKQTKAVVNRLARIEGHVHSIKQMVEEGRECADILVQLAAVRAALDKVGRVVLEDHLESCLFHVGVVPEDNEVWASLREALDLYLR